ncbi:YihY/virulence factor BrkB family protein [Jatrophihabitans sp. YIM 134969]
MVEPLVSAFAGHPFPLRRRAVKILTSPGAVLRRIGLLLLDTVRSAWHHRILGLSAETAFWQLLSLPSLLIALLASLGYLSFLIGPDTVIRAHLQLEEAFGQAFSPQVVDQLIGPTLDDVLHGNRLGVVSLGFLLALWAGSSATATFVNTITIAYGQRDERGAVRSRLLALWLFLGSVLVGVVVLPMLVLGPDLLAKAFPEGARSTAAAVVNAAYYPVVGLLVLLGLTSLYRLSPPRRLSWLRGLPGATLALAVFLAGSAGLRAYITFVISRNDAYGSLGTPVAALLFFYVLALGVLLGAEFNAAIERTWPSLPPTRVRDTAAARIVDRGWTVISDRVPVLPPATAKLWSPARRRAEDDDDQSFIAS